MGKATACMAASAWRAAYVLTRCHTTNSIVTDALPNKICDCLENAQSELSTASNSI